MSYVADSLSSAETYFDRWRDRREEAHQARRQRRVDRRTDREAAFEAKTALRAQRLAVQTERDQRRGYAVDLKRVVMAYGVELVIVAASLYGAWLFALTYGHDANYMAMMMLAPLAYAAFEICRVPLALTFRSHSSRMIRFLAMFGVLCAAGVTVKSMSQLGEIMFRPRLFDVVHAQEHLHDAEAADAAVVHQIALADAAMTDRANEYHLATDKAKAAGSQLAALPAACGGTYIDKKTGVVLKSNACGRDSRANVMTANLATAQKELGIAQAKLDEARMMRAKLDQGASDAAVTAAQIEYREAVLKSQLHSFTGMVFGLAPTEVSDGQIYQFLRIFVFFPAIFVSLASTLLAFTAVRRLPPSTIHLDDRAGHFVLGPFSDTVFQEAANVARHHAEQTIATARNKAS